MKITKTKELTLRVNQATYSFHFADQYADEPDALYMSISIPAKSKDGNSDSLSDSGVKIADLLEEKDVKALEGLLKLVRDVFIKKHV